MKEIQDLIKDMEIETIDDSEQIHLRSSGKWKMEDMTEFVKKLTEEYSGQVIRINIDKFYQNFHIGDSEIIHKGHYCKKRVEKILETLGIDGKVGTTKKWNGTIVIQL